MIFTEDSGQYIVLQPGLLVREGPNPNAPIHAREYLLQGHIFKTSLKAVLNSTTYLQLSCGGWIFAGRNIVQELKNIDSLPLGYVMWKDTIARKLHGKARKMVDRERSRLEGRMLAELERENQVEGDRFFDDIPGVCQEEHVDSNTIPEIASDSVLTSEVYENLSRTNSESEDCVTNSSNGTASSSTTSTTTKMEYPVQPYFPTQLTEDTHYDKESSEQLRRKQYKMPQSRYTQQPARVKALLLSNNADQRLMCILKR